MMFDTILETVKKTCPLIHNITNYVTVNDCANLLIACGASPIMADDVEEVAEITSICNGLYLNIGTLNSRTVASMMIAGKKANELHHPVVLDPVGVGASKLRTTTALRLLEEIDFAVIRGNSSEIKSLAFGQGNAKGVDADLADQITAENLEDAVYFVKQFAKQTGAIVVMTGAIDIVADDKKAYCIGNGHPMMSTVTGTGCQLSALITAFVSSNENCRLEATAAAVIAMGISGEIAYHRLLPGEGNASYRTYLIDAIYNLTPLQLLEGAKYEVR